HGPGIRCLIEGGIRIDTRGHSASYGPGGAWYETGPDGVFAQAANRPTRFIRVMILPRALLGKSSIEYLNEEDKAKPKSQSYKIFVDMPIELRERHPGNESAAGCAGTMRNDESHRLVVAVDWHVDEERRVAFQAFGDEIGGVMHTVRPLRRDAERARETDIIDRRVDELHADKAVDLGGEPALRDQARLENAV